MKVNCGKPNGKWEWTVVTFRKVKVTFRNLVGKWIWLVAKSELILAGKGKVNCAVELCLIFTFILTLFSKVKEVMRYKEQMSLWKCWKWKFKIRKNNSWGLETGSNYKGDSTPPKYLVEEQYEHDICVSIYFELEALIFFFYWFSALILHGIGIRFAVDIYVKGPHSWLPHLRKR